MLVCQTQHKEGHPSELGISIATFRDVELTTSHRSYIEEVIGSSGVVSCDTEQIGNSSASRA